MWIYKGVRFSMSTMMDQTPQRRQDKLRTKSSSLVPTQAELCSTLSSQDQSKVHLQPRGKVGRVRPELSVGGTEEILVIRNPISQEEESVHTHIQQVFIEFLLHTRPLLGGREMTANKADPVPVGHKPPDLSFISVRAPHRL